MTVVLGDTSKGSVGIRARSFPESRHHIKTMVDPFGTGLYEEVPGDVLLTIVPGFYDHMQVVVPSLVTVNTSFKTVPRALDLHGNPTQLFKEIITFEIIDNTAQVVTTGSVSFEDSQRGVVAIPDTTLSQEGLYYIVAKRDGIEIARSNALRVQSTIEKKLWWADLHGQTKHAVGSGSFDEYYTFARDFGILDVTSCQCNDFQITNKTWEENRDITHQYNEPGAFVTFLGYEWSGNSPNGGDHNVMFKGDNATFYPSSNWMDYTKECSPALNAVDIPALYEKFEGRKDVMTIKHIGGRRAVLDFHNPEFGSLIEVHSHHGTSEWFIHDAMKKRIKVGFVAGSDDHTCRQGLSYPIIPKNEIASSFDVYSGLTGIYADALTRESIWEALVQRRCYATTFNRLILDVRMQNQYMGSELEIDGIPELDITVSSNTPLEKIQIYNWDREIFSKQLLKKQKKTIRVSWGGVRARNRRRAAKWDGKITLSNGRFLNPKEFAFDRADQGIVSSVDNAISFVSNTSGDVDGIIVTIEALEQAKLTFHSQYVSFSLFIVDISESPTVIDAGGENLHVCVELANEEIFDKTAFIESCNTHFRFLDELVSSGEHAYWIKVTQSDGHMAWSSPLYVNKR